MTPTRGQEQVKPPISPLSVKANLCAAQTNTEWITETRPDRASENILEIEDWKKMKDMILKKELGKAEMMIEEKHWNKTKRIQKRIYVEKSLWQIQRFWTYFKKWGNLSLILTSVISYMLNLYETICCVELWSN